LIPTEQTVRVGAIGVLDAYGQILVGYNVKRAVWDIPQGVIEEGESPVQGAIRELFEETGLNLNAKDLSEIGKFSHRTREFVYPFENYLFLLELSNVDLSPVRNCEPEKCRDLGWRAPCQLPSPRGLSLRLLLVLLGRSE
jgi:8-oxo-dGTP pyrophosphatase MutT (NUDIX family)